MSSNIRETEDLALGNPDGYISKPADFENNQVFLSLAEGDIETIDEQSRSVENIPCDSIILNDGKIISANIIETTDSSVIYSPCETEDFTEITLAKKEIKALQYSSGKFEFIQHESAQEAYSTERHKSIKKLNGNEPQSEMNNGLRIFLIVLGSIGLTILAGIGIILSAIVLSNLFSVIGVIIGVLGIYFSITIALYLFLLMINRGEKEGLFKKAALITLFGLLAVGIVMLILGFLN